MPKTMKQLGLVQFFHGSLYLVCGCLPQML